MLETVIIIMFAVFVVSSVPILLFRGATRPSTEMSEAISVIWKRAAPGGEEK